MADWLEGPVTQVVDGDTFDMSVARTNNPRAYSGSERIRLANANAPETGTPGGAAATSRLQQQIAGRGVHCDVRARDTFGRLVCGRVLSITGECVIYRSRA